MKPAPSDGKKRKQRDAEATREAILQVATEEYARVGLHGARVEEIASRTATSKHMIYYYFGSKEGLYRAVLEKAYADFRSAETAVDYDAMDPVAALEMLIGISFDTHRANPHVIRIIMSENLDQGSHLAADDQTVQRAKVLDITRRILDRGKQAGMFADDATPLHLHMSLSALCFHFHSNRYTFGTIFAVDYENPAFVEERRAEVIRTLMKRCLK